VNWVTDRTNLGRPELHLDDEKQDADHAGRLGWHVYPAVRVTDRCLKRALSGSARYLEGGRRARHFQRTGSLEHDPEKWKPVFRKDHAQTKR